MDHQISVATLYLRLKMIAIIARRVPYDNMVPYNPGAGVNVLVSGPVNAMSDNMSCQ